MANSGGRLDRLGRAYGTVRIDERAHLLEMYGEYHDLETAWYWRTGTADAIMRALCSDTAHVFAYYDEEGNRTVLSIGPFYRDAQGAIQWRWFPICHHSETLEYQESFADGIPSYCKGGVHLPDGTYWSESGRQPKPTPAALREMVVTKAKERDELELLDQAVQSSGGWMAWLVAGTKKSEE